MISKDNFWSSVLAAGGIGELSTGDSVFDRRARCVWRVLESTLVAAQDVAQVECWEDVLELVPGAGLPLVERKAAVLRVLCEELPFTVALLPGRLRQLLGEGNFTVTQEDDRVTVAVALDTTEAQIAEVESLLDRVLPRNLVTAMEWADGLPIDYTHVEYLENVIGDSSDSASILTDIKPTQNTRGKLVAEAVESSYGLTCYAFGSGSTVNDKTPPFSCAWWFRPQTNGGNEASFYLNGIKQYSGRMSAGVHILEFGKDGFRVDGDLKGTFEDIGEFESPRKLMFLSETPVYKNARCFRGKAYSFKLWENDVPILNFVPALDPTGAPCFFDLVTKEPYYSETEHDFTYPGMETEATTYSLRNRKYGKITEHGIRRLYRVPKGYNGSKEAYAAEHGFKILVETPMPEVGTWAPVWHEREDCIELEWVECEPPAEAAEGEVSEN